MEASNGGTILLQCWSWRAPANAALPQSLVGTGKCKLSYLFPSLKPTQHCPFPWLRLVAGAVSAVSHSRPKADACAWTRHLSCCTAELRGIHVQVIFLLPSLNKRTSPTLTLSSCLPKDNWGVQSTEDKPWLPGIGGQGARIPGLHGTVTMKVNYWQATPCPRPMHYIDSRQKYKSVFLWKKGLFN